jgi:hypothetical protein
MKDTSGVGSVTEGMILAALLLRGKKIFIPFNGASRYDLLLDDEKGKFIRVQCKTARIRKGVVKFRTYSVTAAGMNYYSKDDIDAFGVYCPDNGKTYFVPIEKCVKGTMSLRIEPSKSIKTGLRFAKDFEF